MKLRISIHGVLDVTYERESKLTEYAMLDKDVVMHVKALVTHTVDEALRLQAPAMIDEPTDNPAPRCT